MVHVRTDPDQRSLRISEPNLLTLLDLLRIGILDCKSQFDIVDCSLGIVSPRFFSLKRTVSLVFFGHRIFCHLDFRCAC